MCEWFQILFGKFALKRVQKLQAPMMIGSSIGQHWLLANFDCVTSDDRYLFKSIDGHNINCLKWNDNLFDESAEVKISEVNFKGIEFFHWYDGINYTYKGLWRFFFDQAFKIHFFLNRFERWQQKNFNRSFKLREDRRDVLKEIYELGLLTAVSTNKRDPFVAKTALEWFFEIHGHRSAQHPEYQRNFLKFKAILLSLFESKDLEFKEFKYSITGTALKSLADFELEERRHNQQLATNRQLVRLTFVIAAAAITQVIVAYWKP